MLSIMLHFSFRRTCFLLCGLLEYYQGLPHIWTLILTPGQKPFPYAERFAKAKLNQGWMGWGQEAEAIVYHAIGFTRTA
jgi:hypothetical protein